MLLEKYGIGSNIRRIIETVWRDDTMTTRQNKYYGKPFMAERRVRKGDIISPTIFNIVVDAIIRDCEQMMINQDVFIQFYADDGFIGGLDNDKVQVMLNIMEENFKKVGLLMNNIKTESMIMLGSKPVDWLSDDA